MIVVNEFIDDDVAQYIKNDIIPNIDFNMNNGLVYGDDGEPVKDDSAFIKIILGRPDAGESDVIIDENLIGFFVDLFKVCLQKAGGFAEYSIKRIAINATFSNVKHQESAIHKDHNFDHKQMLICLNDDFIGGGTAIYKSYPDTKDREVLGYQPMSARIFDSVYHTSIFPEKGVRIMAVYTFTTGSEDEVRSKE